MMVTFALIGIWLIIFTIFSPFLFMVVIAITSLISPKHGKLLVDKFKVAFNQK